MQENTNMRSRRPKSSKRRRRSPRRSRSRQRTRRSGGRRYRAQTAVATPRVVCSIDFDSCGEIILLTDPFFRDTVEKFKTFLQDNPPTHVFSASARCFFQGWVDGRKWREQDDRDHVALFLKHLTPKFVAPKSLTHMTMALNKPTSFGHDVYANTAVLNHRDFRVFPDHVKTLFNREWSTDSQTVAKYMWIYKQIFYAHHLFGRTTIQQLVRERLQHFDRLGEPLIITGKHPRIENPNFDPRQDSRYDYDPEYDEEFIEDTSRTEYVDPVGLESYTRCNVVDGWVTAETNVHGYTEVFYTVKEADGKREYTFYRNCSNIAKQPFTFNFMDDSYAETVFTGIRNGTLPHPDIENVTLRCVHFDAYASPTSTDDVSPTPTLTFKRLTN